MFRGGRSLGRGSSAMLPAGGRAMSQTAGIVRSRTRQPLTLAQVQYARRMHLQPAPQPSQGTDASGQITRDATARAAGELTAAEVDAIIAQQQAQGPWT